MKRILYILMIIVLLLTFVACDGTPDKSDSDSGQNSSQSDDQGGGDQGGSPADDQGQSGGGQTDPVPKATFTVTFIQGEEDPVVEKYEEGDPLWLHAPDLGAHNVLSYYYNWDAELDAEVSSDMTVTRIEDEGYAVFFMNVEKHAIKIIAKETWTTLPVSDFPVLPEIEGYTGVWDPAEDIVSPPPGKTEVTCWYYSTEKHPNTGMSKSFIAYGGDAFTISEYPIQVSGSTLKYVNKTNFDLASNGMTGVNSDEAASMISGISPSATDYEEMTYCEKTDWLIQNLPDASRLINAIKVMRQQTEDDKWSIPTAGCCRYIGYALYALEGESNYFSYLSKDLTRVRFLNSDRFYLSSYSSAKWMDYSFMEDGYATYGMASTGWNFSSGSFTGYLWPIKPITVE